MVNKLLAIYKKEFTLRNIIFRYFNWRTVTFHYIFIFGSIILACTLAIVFRNLGYILVSFASIIVFPNLLKKMELERDRILKDIHNCSDFTSLRLRRLKKFLKDESLDHAINKIELLISLVDKQAEETRVPFLVGRGAVAAFLIPIWIQCISWILNKKIETVESFTFFIVLLIGILIVIIGLLSFWKMIVHDEIVNGDYNRLKLISNDLREMQFKN